MKTTRSEFVAHQSLTVRAQRQLIEKAEWSRMLAKRETKISERNRRNARRAAPRNQSGRVAYVCTLIMGAIGAAVSLFGRFI